MTTSDLHKASCSCEEVSGGGTGCCVFSATVQTSASAGISGPGWHQLQYLLQLSFVYQTLETLLSCKSLVERQKEWVRLNTETLGGEGNCGQRLTVRTSELFHKVLVFEGRSRMSEDIRRERGVR